MKKVKHSRVDSVTSKSSRGNFKIGETIRSTNGRMSHNSSSLFGTGAARGQSKDKKMKAQYSMYYKNNDAISGISKYS